jgi:3,4-dihydroxy-2-butanone 4-phosphate synthase
MDKAKVKDAILKTAGYPESGVIAELADAMAEAVINIDKAIEIKKFEPVKETRIQEIKETR